jgi:hypothetical protein
MLGFVLVLAAGLAAGSYIRAVFARGTVSDYMARHGAYATLHGEAFRFEGETYRCAGAPTVTNPRFPEYGAAYFGYLIFNPDRFLTMPSTVRRFAYLHECGHQYVGYSETSADCYAARLGRRQGWFGPQAVDEVCAFLSSSKGTPFHLPGPQRCASIRRCLGS